MKSGELLRYVRTAAVALLMVVAVAGRIPAQTGNASIHGTVQDQSGGAVQNASVAAVAADGTTESATSSRVGAFEIRGLNPGTYTVQVTIAGFAPYSKANVVVGNGQSLLLDVSLSIQAQQEKVTVNGDAPTALDISPGNNASALVLTQDDLAALPDDPDELETDLQALAGPSPGPNGGQMYIDGFTAGQLPPKSSIREIRVNSNPFSSEYDRVGYGRIEVFTKPGTDKWHGQGFINENNAIFNSKDPFAPHKPPFQSVQLNGNVGGPLSKHASIFVNTDYRDIQDQQVVSAFTGLNSGVPVAFSQVVASPHTRVNFSPRIDYQLTKNNTLSVRYQYFYNNNRDTGVGGFSLASLAYNTLSTEHTVQISDTQIIGSRVINETHFQLLHEDVNQTALNFQPTISVQGAFTGGGSGSGNSVDRTNRYEFQNYTSIALPKHFIKFGARVRLTTDSNSATSGFNGAFSFASLSTYVAGNPSQFSFTAGAAAASVSTEDSGLYFEDDWKLRPNITLSYGLRFETQTHISDHFDWAPRLGIAWGVGKSKTAPKTVLRAGFGIFYDRFGAGQILQAARESLINPLQQQYIFTSNLANLYSACKTSLADSGCQTAITTSGASARTPTFYQLASNLHAPYSWQTAVSVERQLTKAANLSVSYLHTSGYDQFDTDNVNSPVGCDTLTNSTCTQDATLRPNGIVENIYQYQSRGIFRQNQLIANVNVRMGAKVTLNGYYTLNYASGDTSGVNSFPSNPYNLMQDYGRTQFDVRHRAFISGTVVLPWDLHLSPFMVLQSGTPYNLTLAQDLIGSSRFNQRPAFATSCSAGATVVSTSLGCFNTDPIGNPGDGSVLVPAYYLTGKSEFALNLRLTKSFGFGKVPEAAGGARGGRGGGGGGGPRGGGGPGRGPGGPGGFGGGGGGGGARTVAKRYNFTLSANARNVFNNVNYGTPSGSITSPILGRSNSLAGGTFSNSTSGANRQVFLQLQFAF
jgi:hypothetical protein